MYKQSREYKDLNDKELLNLLVSDETASYLLEEHLTLEDIIFNTYPQELETVKGVGSKTASRLLAIGEIAYRLFHKEPTKREKITRPDDVFNLNKDIQHSKQEEVRAIYLNIKNYIIKVETITIGTTTFSPLTPKDVFSRAIKLNAEAIILTHNHPSGVPTPSNDDIKITKKLISVGELLNIQLLDHIIIGQGIYYSLKERGDI